jgi:hypothetical protein
MFVKWAAATAVLVLAVFHPALALVVVIGGAFLLELGK